MVQVFGSKEQKMDILPSFVTGEKVGNRISLMTFMEARDPIDSYPSVQVHLLDDIHRGTKGLFPFEASTYHITSRIGFQEYIQQSPISM